MSQLEPNKLGQRDASLDLMNKDAKTGIVDALAADSLVITQETKPASVIPDKPTLLKPAAAK